MYELPAINFKKIKDSLARLYKNRVFWLIIAVVLISSFCGFAAGIFSSKYFNLYFNRPNLNFGKTTPEYIPQTSQEQAIINAVKEFSPAVVSIVISKDVPIMEEYFYNPFGENSPFGFEIPGYRQKGTQKQEVGGGSGFIVSGDGLVLTNKHVVLDEQAEYTVFTNDGKKFPAKVLARDPVQDLAIIKIEREKTLNNKGEFGSEIFPIVKLGDSKNLQIGQTVIAIGNALGEFRNTVSVGVISGLGRTISASGEGGFAETLEDIIQTDAAINKGNSGGPLLNLKGEVIGINTAMAQEAQSIGFAIPINYAKKDIEQIKEKGKITYPFLGIRYVVINDEIQKKNNLPINYGAWVIKGEQGEIAITPDSAAEKAGIKEGDIILEFSGEKITKDNPLAKIILKYNPGDKVVLKILREVQEKTIEVVLGERS